MPDDPNPNPNPNPSPQDPPAEPPAPSPEPTIPKHRFDEINRAKKDAEAELKRIRDEQQQREEERAQNQGEYQQLAEKRQKKIDSLQQEITNLKAQMVRDTRYRAWTSAAAGTIKPVAIGDAFEMITEDEWSTVNEADENSVKMLAQNLAERKEYLAAGPIGSGSRGSGQPVFGLQTNNKGKQGTQTGRPTMHFKKSRPSWK